MENKKINMNSEILKNMKEDLESKIDYAFKKAIKEGKKTKVTLRMTIKTNKDELGNDIPLIEYETGYSVKEDSFKSKNVIGENYISTLDDEGNLVIEEGDKQLEIIEEGADE